MCLALPMRITAVADDGTATLALEGLEQRASLALLPEATIGDYVLVHAGYALSVLTEDEAEETLTLLAELAESAAAEEAELGGGPSAPRSDDGGRPSSAVPAETGEAGGRA
ncbi:MAG: HypC/HybG/HupF family hydrogenase formation chaperone [Thermoleophilia bacterium]|nr:HypC/HybG/HupF family hydrogenase formation chaperone [Thermoleophilia bacterium]